MKVIWVVLFFVAQFFLFLTFVDRLPPLESEPIQVIVSKDQARFSSPIIDPSPLPVPSPVPIVSPCPEVSVDDQTIPQLLAKIQTLGAAVKFQNEEIHKQHKSVTVVSSSKVVNSIGSARNPIRVISYNLWNVNSLWEKRMEHISNLLLDKNADVIGFQEVRTLNRQSALNILTPYRMNSDLPIDGTIPMPSTSRTMMDLVYSYLGDEYPWAVFVPMAGFHDGTQEGVAIMSKHPIVEISAGDLNVVGQYSDRNTRGVLRGRISIPNRDNPDEELFMDFFNTHLTYDDKQQCPMIIKLLDYLEDYYDENENIPQIIVGDLNTYLTSEWPIDFLENPFSPLSKSSYNLCYSQFSKWIESHQDNENKPYFSDVWNEAFPRNDDGAITSRNSKDEINALGHTFPVFKDSPLTNCRPDRILRRKSDNVNLLSVATFGDEPWTDSNHLNPEPHYLSDHLGIEVNFDFL